MSRTLGEDSFDNELACSALKGLIAEGEVMAIESDESDYILQITKAGQARRMLQESQPS